MAQPPDLLHLIKIAQEADLPNPRGIHFSFCNRSGQGRYTRKLRCKDDIRAERKRQKLARRQSRGRN